MASSGLNESDLDDTIQVVDTTVPEVPVPRKSGRKTKAPDRLIYVPKGATKKKQGSQNGHNWKNLFKYFKVKKVKYFEQKF